MSENRTTYVCLICKKNGFDTMSIGGVSKDEIMGTPGTNFGRFKTFAEYAWHMKNIHQVDLKRTEANQYGRSVTRLISCDCWLGLASMWGSSSGIVRMKRGRPKSEEV